MKINKTKKSAFHIKHIVHVAHLTWKNSSAADTREKLVKLLFFSVCVEKTFARPDNSLMVIEVGVLVLS